MPPTSRKLSKTRHLNRPAWVLLKASVLIILLFRVFLPSLTSLRSWDYKAFQNAYADPSIAGCPCLREENPQVREVSRQQRSPQLASPWPGRVRRCMCLLNPISLSPDLGLTFLCGEASLAREEESSLGEQCEVQEVRKISLF